MHKLCDALGHRRQPGFSPTLLQVENGRLRAELADLRRDVADAAEIEMDDGALALEALSVIRGAVARADSKLCPYCDGPKHPEDDSCRWENCEKAAEAAEPSQTVCGHQGCTKRPGHIPGHHD
jgi:hypothetical protein